MRTSRFFHEHVDALKKKDSDGIKMGMNHEFGVMLKGFSSG